MDEPTYTAWSELHRRHVLGETLTAEEQTTYEAGCREIESTVNYEGDIPRLRQLREQLREARLVSERLRQRQATADAEIAELEARLDPRSRQLLGIAD